MEEKIVFKNDHIQVAADFAKAFSHILPEWNKKFDREEARKFLQDEVTGETPTVYILWEMRKKVKGPFVAIAVSEMLTDGSIAHSNGWKATPEKVRSFLRVAANMDLGDWRATDVDRSMGGDVNKSNETASLEKFLAKLEEKVTPSFGENRIS